MLLCKVKVPVKAGKFKNPNVIFMNLLYAEKVLKRCPKSHERSIF